MTEASSPYAFAVLIIGLVAVVAAPLRAGFNRIGLPDIIGYILIGLALGTADSRLYFLSAETRHGLDTLAAAGIVVLLFRAGLESHPRKLVSQLPRAGIAVVGNIVVSAGAGYATSRYLLGTPPIPALFVAAALSATSVGVSLAVWRDEGAIDSDDGALLLDLAELDDVAAVVLLAMLLALAPVVHGNGNGNERTVPEVFAQAGWMLVTLAGFVGACLLFAGFAEKRVSQWFRGLESAVPPIVPVAGIAFLIAALADQLGFSLAVGALFAGLAFSRDPERVRIDKAFDTLFRLFVPFFFVGIGLSVALDLLVAALAVGGILLVAAVAGKIVGTALPLIAASGGAGALLIGVSMVPRAEIAMVVMERGRALGDWAVPPELYAGMVVVALGTCLVTPPIVKNLLRREAKRGHDEY